MTVEELNQRMTSEELTHWMLLEKIEPSGWGMDNWRFAMLASAICNAVIATIPIPKGHSRPKKLQVKDFLPSAARAGPQLTERQKRELEERRDKRRHSHR